MSQSLCILGRQPAIGMAELESLYKASKVHPAGNQAAVVDTPPEAIQFARLGSTMKLGRVLASTSATDWHALEQQLANDILPPLLDGLPDGKVRFGISTYDVRVSVPHINRTALALKKVIRGAGRSVRVVPNQYPDLNSAQILHNQLTGPTGIELLLVRDGRNTLIAQTVAVQDINAYAARDQHRPRRDAFVGMLPPKLAQTMINLANPASGSTVLDPFCGTGVLLQEALLMGFTAYGTDWSERMVEYSSENLAWLKQRFNLSNAEYTVTQGDATTVAWEHSFDTVATETYLGMPLSGYPSDQKLHQIINDVNTLHKKFLTNLAGQIPNGTRLCLAVPAWFTQNKHFLHLPTLDKLSEMGYNRLSFVHASNRELVYHRPDQIVARELVVLIRK